MAEAKCVHCVSVAAWLQLILALFLPVPLSGQELTEATQLATLFQQQVDRRLQVPVEVRLE
jgi:hypothetical protein